MPCWWHQEQQLAPFFLVHHSFDSMRQICFFENGSKLLAKQQQFQENEDTMLKKYAINIPLRSKETKIYSSFFSLTHKVLVLSWSRYSWSLLAMTWLQPSQWLRLIPFRTMVSSEELRTESTPWWNLRNDVPQDQVCRHCAVCLQVETFPNESCDSLCVRFTGWGSLTGRSSCHSDVFHSTFMAV